MSTSLPLDPMDLDLVAAFAAGELEGADADKAKSLISQDVRFANEYATQQVALGAMGADDWYTPLSDLEKFALRKAAVPKKEKPSWAVRALGPLSVAAVLVVLVGFAGMRLIGSGDSVDMTSGEASAATVAAVEIESTGAPSDTAAADGAMSDRTSMDEGDGVEESTQTQIPSAFTPPEVLAPGSGDLSPEDLGLLVSVDELLTFAQWVEPVALDRYPPLTCWADEMEGLTLGVAFVIIQGVSHEVVIRPDAVETRVTGSCESTVLDR